MSVCGARPGFLGVFASDTLPTTVHNQHLETSLIVNYGASDTAGSHWCAMRFHGPGKRAEWFDSFGQAPDIEDGILDEPTEFKSYLLRHAPGYTYNSFDFQNLADDECGEWSAMFVLIGGLPQNNKFRKEWAPFTSVASSQKRDKLVRYAIGVR